MPEAAASRVPGLGWRRPVVAFGVLASVALGVVSLGYIGSDDLFTQLDFVATTAAALSLVVSGAVLIMRLPNHRVGWLLWLGGCLFAIAIAGGTNGVGQLLAAGPGIEGWLELIGGAAWVPAIICVTILLPLVFPTGRLPSPRWRFVAAAGVTAAAFNVVQTVLTPFNIVGTPQGVTNPLAVGGPAAEVANLMGALSSLAGVVCLPIVAASLVLRFRRSTGIERAQLKWLAAAVAIIGPALAVAIATSVLPGDLASFLSSLAFLATFVGLALLPAAIGVAVLRYRLYDIDVIIRRTVVYVPLTAILAGLYAGSTALLQKVFILATGQRSDGAVVASTLILATLFTPIRGWLQGIVDRRFRDQLDTERQLDAFIARVANAEWTPDPTRTLRAFLGVSVGAFEATGGRALVIEGNATRVVASTGHTESPAIVVGIEADGRAVGRIELGPRTRGRAYRPAELELLDVAGQRLGDAMLGIAVPGDGLSATWPHRSLGVEVTEVDLQTEPSQG